MKYILFLLLCSCTVNGQLERAKNINVLHKKFGYVDPVRVDNGLLYIYHYTESKPTTVYTRNGLTVINPAKEANFDILVLTDDNGTIKGHQIKKISN